MAIYTDLVNDFQITDYSATHSQLLLRSMQSKKRGYNIDIVFKGVLLILMPSSFNGLEITLADKISQDILDKYEFKDDKNHRIFSIKDAKDYVYYINAMCFGVYHNNLDILNTSIGRYDFEDHNERVLWYA